jgi:hypothetical protein
MLSARLWISAIIVVVAESEFAGGVSDEGDGVDVVVMGERVVKGMTDSVAAGTRVVALSSRLIAA